MKKTILILSVIGFMFTSCSSQRYCQPSKRSRDYADLYLKDGGTIDSLYTRCILVRVNPTTWGYKHLFVTDKGDSLHRYYQKRLILNECYKVFNQM